MTKLSIIYGLLMLGLMIYCAISAITQDNFEYAILGICLSVYMALGMAFFSSLTFCKRGGC